MKSNELKNLAHQYYSDDFDVYKDFVIRAEMVLNRLKEINVKSVLDIGCGNCYPTKLLLKEGFEVKGFDFSEEMIKNGKVVLKEAGYDPSLISVGDLDNRDTLPQEKFDSSIMLGAFSVVKDEHKVMDNVNYMLKPNGKAFIELRNALFGLFSFNKYSQSFFLNDLIGEQELPGDIRQEIEEFYSKRCFEEKRTEDILFPSKPRLHNPLTVEKELFEPHGFKVDKILFYHYHVMPPIFEDKYPDVFRKLSYNLEKPEDWKGYFMASAYVVEATKT